MYDIATVPNDSHTFLTCSHDQTVRWYDLRVKTSCLKHHPSHSRYGRSSLLRQSHRCMEDVLIRAEHPVTAIAVNGLMPWQLAIGCSDSIVRIYDRRMLSTRSLGGAGCGTGRQVDSSVLAKFTYDGISTTNRITSLAYSRNCQQLLASFSNDFLYLFDLNVCLCAVLSFEDLLMFFSVFLLGRPKYHQALRRRGHHSGQVRSAELCVQALSPARRLVGHGPQCTHLR